MDRWGPEYPKIHTIFFNLPALKTEPTQTLAESTSDDKTQDSTVLLQGLIILPRRQKLTDLEAVTTFSQTKMELELCPPKVILQIIEL